MMLTRAESKFVFKYLTVCSRLCAFPFHVDCLSGKIKQFEGWRFKAWVSLYVLVLFHFLYGFINMIILLTLEKERIVLYHLVIQFDAMGLALLFNSVIFTAFFYEGNTFEKVFNQLYPPLDSSRKRALRKMSIQELMGLAAPLISIGAVVMYVTLITVEYDMYHLIINSAILRETRHNPIIILLATAIEAYAAGFWLLNVGLFLSLNCLVMGKVQEELTQTFVHLR